MTTIYQQRPGFVFIEDAEGFRLQVMQSKDAEGRPITDSAVTIFGSASIHRTQSAQLAQALGRYAEIGELDAAPPADAAACDIEQALAHLRKARAAFVLAGRENDAASVLEAIRKVEGLRLEIGQ